MAITLVVIMWWLIKILGTGSLIGLLGAGVGGIIIWIKSFFGTPWYLTPWGIGLMIAGGAVSIGTLGYYIGKALSLNPEETDLPEDKQTKLKHWQIEAKKFKDGKITRKQFENAMKKRSC